MNEEIIDIINKILDDPSGYIPHDLLRDLCDRLNDCEMYVPFDDDEIVLYGWGPKKYIPVSCDLSDFKQVFKQESPELFKFKHLEDFLTKDISGFFINPGGRSFIFNRYLAKLAFNRDRPKAEVSKAYDVKVRLNDFRPLTWRDLIIPDNITFMELDDILKTLWGFGGHHLSCFLLRKTNQTIIDDDLSKETMMTMDYDANTTHLSEIFDNFNKVTYWYDFGDDWQFDIEIKKKIDYDKDYVTIKRYKGKYNPVEDCKGVYGFSEIIYNAENPDEEDNSYYSELVDYLEEFDMEFTQFIFERKAYIKSNWHRDVYFKE